MTAQELTERRTVVLDSMKSFLMEHRGEDGFLTAENDAKYTEMETELNNLKTEIENQTKIEKEMENMTPILNTPDNTIAEIKIGRASNEYKTAMIDAFRTNFRRVDNVMQEGIDADGGYLVPEEMDARLIQKMSEANVIRSLATVITTAGDHKINIAANSPAANWTEEGGALTWGDATFSQIILDAHKLIVAVKATTELLADSAFDIEAYLTDKFGKALGNEEENQFINGNGSHKPLGILAATGGADVGLTAAGKTDVTADEIINLVYSLKRPYRSNAVWLLNDTTIAAIRKLKDGNGQYLWQPAVQAGEPDRLFGFPVYTSQYMPAMAAGNKAIAFGDFSYYNIGDRGVRSFRRLEELFAGNDMVGFVAKERVDGKLTVGEAIKVIKMHA